MLWEYVDETQFGDESGRAGEKEGRQWGGSEEMGGIPVCGKFQK